MTAETFKATRASSADQTSIADNTFTTIALNSVVQSGSEYSTSTYEWTPQAGAVVMNGRAIFELPSDGTSYELRLLKNGSAIDRDREDHMGGTLHVSYSDIANGTDAYKLEVRKKDGSVDGQLSGNGNHTFFNGTSFGS